METLLPIHKNTCTPRRSVYGFSACTPIGWIVCRLYVSRVPLFCTRYRLIQTFQNIIVGLSCLLLLTFKLVSLKNESLGMDYRGTPFAIVTIVTPVCVQRRDRAQYSKRHSLSLETRRLMNSPGPWTVFIYLGHLVLRAISFQQYSSDVDATELLTEWGHSTNYSPI